MAKTVFIAQPTSVMTTKEIQSERSRISKALLRKDIVPLNAKYDGNTANNDSTTLFVLGKAVQQLAVANAVLFCDNWREDRVCRLLHSVCVNFDIDMMTENDFFKEDFS